MPHPPERSGRRFHLEINGLDAFAAFCAILRGDLSPESVEAMRTMAAQLDAGTNDLAEALLQDGHTEEPP